MNITKVEMPDGRLLTIEGGNAQQIASIITNDFVRNVPVSVENAPTEEPMTMPVLNFSKEQRQEQIQSNAEGEEVALEMPKMF